MWKNRCFPSAWLAWRSALPQEKARDKGVESQAAQAELVRSSESSPWLFKCFVHFFWSKLRDCHLWFCKILSNNL